VGDDENPHYQRAALVDSEEYDNFYIGKAAGSINNWIHINHAPDILVNGSIYVGWGEGATMNLFQPDDGNLTVKGSIYVGYGEGSFYNHIEMSGTTLTVEGAIHLGYGEGSYDNYIWFAGGAVLAEAIYVYKGSNTLGVVDFYFQSTHVTVGGLAFALDAIMLLGGEGAELDITRSLRVTIEGGGAGEYTQLGLYTDEDITGGQITFSGGMRLDLDINGMFEVQEGMTFEIITSGFVNDSLGLRDGMTFESDGWIWKAIDPSDGTFSIQAIQQIPEPSAWLLLGAGAAFAAIFRRRRS